MTKITIAHGGGGRTAQKLIQEYFFKYFQNEILMQADDSALLHIPEKRICFTTDSFVIKPVFFPGGDIGKLAVCGTVNDLSVNGAVPLYLSCGFILEEGLDLADLERIISSMAKTAEDAGVKIVTGDTKVVEKGSADKLFITTSGIGVIPDNINEPRISRILPGDKIILTGNIGDHGLAVLSQRKELEFRNTLQSDCACLNHAISALLAGVKTVKFMRDPTRGGVATVLNEISRSSKKGILIDEEKIPVSPDVLAACELLGFDPLYIANEGKALIIVGPEDERNALSVLTTFRETEKAVSIGEITKDDKVILKSKYNTKRILNLLSGDQLPRIC